MDSRTSRPNITPDSAIIFPSLMESVVNAFAGEIINALTPMSLTKIFDPDPIKYVLIP